MTFGNESVVKAARQHLEPIFADFDAAIKSGEPAHKVQSTYAPVLLNALHAAGLHASGHFSDLAKGVPEPGSDFPPPADKNDLGVPIGVNPFSTPLQTPDSVEAVQKIVQEARSAGQKVRVIGAAHSRPKEIIADTRDNFVLVSLTKYRGVVLDKVKNVGYVKAGTNLGKDPENPDSTKENSLCYILDQAGYALPETGGIIHQTMGGFLATGSAGGSFKYAFGDAVIGYTLVDGTGRVREISLDKPADASLFAAAGVCAGLCGIVTDVVIKLEPRFYVKGTQQTWSVSSAGQPGGLPVNMFGDPTIKGLPELPQFFEGVDHCRMMYWPQSYLPPRVQIWQGERAPTTGPVIPYEELKPIMQALGAITLQAIHNWLVHGWTWLDWLAAKLLNAFVPLGDLKPFNDTWWLLLPMDNGIVDTLLPTCFTELWVDKADTTRAMRVMRELFETDTGAVGNYFTELYTAKKSPFWLSPSFAGDKVRIDTNWCMYNTQNGDWKLPYASPVPFFTKYWDALDKAGIHFTSHLGKYRPQNHGTLEKLRQDYPKYDEWVKIRHDLDPDRVFLTQYWVEILCLGQA